MAQSSRRSFLAAIAASAVTVGLAACTPWGRHNDKPSEEALQAMDSLDAALRKLPGVRRVETTFTTKAMQKHVIGSVVWLQPDLAAADLVAFGTGAHAAVVAHQVEPYETHVTARAMIGTSNFDWPIGVRSQPSRYPAAIDGIFGELSRGASGASLSEFADIDATHLRSYWSHLDEAALLTATPTGIQQIERRLDAGVPEGTSWVNVVMHQGHPDANLPYEQALTDLTPVLQSSTTTLGTDRRRWLVQFTDQPVDSPDLTTAVTAFLRTLRTAGKRWDEIEFQYPWHVMLAINGDVNVSHWLDGNSDRAAAEPVVTAVVAAANRA